MTASETVVPEPSGQTTPAINVAVVDDHFATRVGLKTFLQEISFIGEVHAFPGSAGLFESHESTFDAVLLDVELKHESGLDICRRLRATRKHVQVIMMSAHNDPRYIAASEQYGADGYILKDAEGEEIERVLHTVLVQHRTSFPGVEAGKATQLLPLPEHGLTARETEILLLICEGYSSKEIAGKLYREESTIAKHRQNLMKKIAARNGFDMYKYASDHGLIKAKNT